MKKLIPIISIVMIAAAVIGYGFMRAKTADQDVPKTVAENTHMTKQDVTTRGDHAHDAMHGAKLAGTRIDLQNADGLKPGEVTLAFKLYGADAHEFGLADLKVVHEKRMHLILLRDDMTGFQHVHPEYNDGQWTVKTTIANQGAYQMYVDIEPVEESPITLRVPLTIGGTTQQPQFPSVSANMSATVSGIQATLQTASELKTKEHANLIFSLTQNGKLITQIDPYLGAFGHVVVLRHGDPDDFIHGHPITETKPIDGKVVFESEFPTKGTYTIFAQFSINGQVKTFPITVSVGSEGQAPADHETTTNTDEHGGSSH
ncbi:MAG: hypothetical protein AAB384_01400 [Patescibacteria group bacterium]